ncbi:MAG: extracellular solute-binding protein [Treponema sp.]|jgi:multiple sugar transport system substrate-binding protein|nr:extracellular solute-binding protein [Treponema sp.]
MNRKRELRAALLAAPVLAFFLACSGSGGGKAGDKTEFTFATWAAGQELQEFQEIVDRVNEKAQGTRINVLSVPSDYYIKLSTLIASRKTPDFFWLTQELISRYAQLGAIADISAPFTAGDALNPGRYYEGVLASAEYQGRYYGLPWIANPLIVYLNKNLFDEAGLPCPDPLEGWTWDEFIETARRLTLVRKDGLGNDYQQYGCIVDGWPNIETFIWAGGGDIIADNGVDITLDSEDSLKGLDILHRILHSGISPEYSKVSSLGSNNVWFEKQRAAMFMGGIQDNFEKKIAALPPEERFEIEYAPMPTGLDGKSWSFDWTASTVLAKNLEDSPLAYEILEKLTLEFFQWKIAPPLLGSVEQALRIDPLKEKALPVMELVLRNARSANYVPEWNEINNLLWVKLYTGMLNDRNFDYRSEAAAIAVKSREFIAKRKGPERQ